jgi:hypothetical protein
MDEVPVVKEYPDVFPEELPGMPPDRYVKFIIDGHRRIKGIKEAAQGTVGQRFYPTEFIIMGIPYFVCRKEGL